MNLLVTGGCGYIGTPLTQTLLALGHQVTVIDANWHGCHLTTQPQLSLRLARIQQLESYELEGYDAIIHLAGLADSGEALKQPNLVWATNVEATTLLVERAINAGVPHFIHCSDAAVFGGSAVDQARTEADPVHCDSVLAKSLVHAERLLQSYRHDLRVDIVRAGAVCGVSPRMRLDLPVNLFAMQALTRGRITVNEAGQSTSHVHLRDLIRLFVTLLDGQSLPAGLVHAGFETCNQLELALRVAAQISCDVEIGSHCAGTSVQLDSSRLRGLGFQPTYSIDDAIWEIAAEYRMGRLRDNERCYNTRFRSIAALAA